MTIVGGHLINVAIALVFVLLVVGGVVALVLFLTHRPSPLAGTSYAQQLPWQPPLPQQALAELDLRYARGEIEREEYLQRRADLMGQPGTPPTAGPTTPR
jgi:putative membrane protein